MERSGDAYVRQSRCTRASRLRSCPGMLHAAVYVNHASISMLHKQHCIAFANPQSEQVRLKAYGASVALKAALAGFKALQRSATCAQACRAWLQSSATLQFHKAPSQQAMRLPWSSRK